MLGLVPAVILVAACGASATPVPAAATPTPAAATLTPTIAPTAAPATAAATAAASPSVDPVALAALFAGKYAGTWKNTTFGSTGSAAVEITVDQAARTMSAKMTLGGNVFGRPAPSPETLTLPISPSGGTSTSTLFGPVTVTAVPDGTGYKVTFAAPNVPSTRIATFTATGTITNPASINLAYTVTFRDGTAPAQGTVALTRS